VEPALEVFQKYKENIDFLVVYIMEAHACDEWPLGTKTVIPQHKSTENRIQVAKGFKQTYNWTIPLVVDPISNEFNQAFSAWPERLFVVQDLKVTYIAQPEDGGYELLWPHEVKKIFDLK